ncbi:MAG: hypothetical protein HZB61_03035 [Nitrospirae bacterium]|nr:hypothetical protein [Nitrospirota bacterium]
MKKPCLSTNNHEKISSNPIYLLLLAAIFLVFAAMTSMLNTSFAQAGPIVSISEGDEWHYFKGTQKPPRGWNRNGFDYSNWQKGPSGFGYGKTSNKTNLGDMRGNYSTVYARSEFDINNIYAVGGMTLSLFCDGAFVAYLNGIEIIRNDSGRMAEQFDVSGFIHELLPGKNVLSVECSNDDINSNDFSFIPYFKILESQKGGIQ